MNLGLPAERHRLPNGLRVVLSPDRTAPVVGVNLWYAVGSRDEREGRTGFAHLFEHLMFQGSEHVPKNGHFEMIERAGGSLNGTTWFDRTNYFETLPSHHLDLALWLESDRMGWMLGAMDQERLDNQRDVVKNEKRQRYDNQPYGDWDERLQSLVYPEGHPYRHPVIGSMEDLDAASLDDVRDFFRTYYVPSNAVLTLCGDFEPTDALERVERWFGEIEGGSTPPPVPGGGGVGPVLGETVRDRVESEVPLPRLYAGFRIPTFTDDRFPVAEVAASVLGSGKASRLYRRLVREERIAKDVGSVAFPLLTGSSFMLVVITGYPGTDPDALEEGLAREADALADVDPDEVERAVAVAGTRLVREVQRVGRRADLLSMFETVFEDAERLNTEVDRLRAVTPGDVRDFAAERLGPENRAFVTYVPREAP